MIASLEAQISSHEMQISKLERELATAAEKSAAHNIRIRELETQVRQLEVNDDRDTTEIQDQLREQNADFREQIEELEMQLRADQEQCDCLQLQLEQSQSTLDATRQCIEEAKTDLKASEQQAETYRTQVKELRLLLQTSEDKLIVNEASRASIQAELATALQSDTKQTEQIKALNTSLINVRKRLAELQISHKSELETVTMAGEIELVAAKAEFTELNAQLDSRCLAYERDLAEAQAAQSVLQQHLESAKQQVISMESTIRHFSETEENVSINQDDLRAAFRAETARHAQIAQTAESEIEALRVTKTSLTAQLKSQHEELDQIKATHRALITDNEEKIQLLQKFQESSLRLEAEMKTSNLALVAATHEFEQCRSTSDSRESTIRALSEELSAARLEFQNELLKRSDDLFSQTRKTQDLLDQLNAAEDRCLQLEHEKDRLKLSLTAAEQRLAAKTERMTVLNAEIHGMTNGIVSGGLAPELDDSSRQFEMNELAALKETLNTLKLQVGDLSSQKNLLAEQLEEASLAHAQYRTETNEIVRKAGQELQASHAALQIERQARCEIQVSADKRLTEQIEAAANERRTLQLKISDLQNSLPLAKQSHAISLSNMSQLPSNTGTDKEIVGILQHEIASVQSRNKELEMKLLGHQKAIELIDQLESQIADLEDDLESSQAHAQADVAQLNDLLLEERRERERVVGLLQTEKDRLQESRSRTGCSFEHHAHEAEELKRQLQTAKHDLQSEKTALVNMKTELLCAQKAGKHLQDELARSAAACKARNSELSTKERKLNDYRREFKQKCEENSSLERRYQALMLQARTTQQESNSYTALQSTLARQREQHGCEIAGLTKMMQYMRSKLTREESFRSALAYMKMYYDKQISSFEACNQANLSIIRQIGIYADETHKKRRPKFRSVARFVVGTIRMRNLSRQWSATKIAKDKIDIAIRSRRAREADR